MNIFQKINKLDIPKDEYVVVGGGVLVALGLLEWDEDIDMTVSERLFTQLKNEDWKTEYFGDKEVLKKDIYDVGIGFGNWSLEDLQQDAIIINGISFISLEKILEWKRQMDRPKDQQHIKIVLDYLSPQSR